MPDIFTRNRDAEDGYLNMSVTAVSVLVMDGVEWDCVSYSRMRKLPVSVDFWQKVLF